MTEGLENEKLKKKKYQDLILKFSHNFNFLSKIIIDFYSLSIFHGFTNKEKKTRILKNNQLYKFVT